MKRTIVSLLLALVLTLSVFTGFASAEGEGQYINGVWKYNEPVTVTCYYRCSGALEDANNLWIFEWARQNMNIDFQVLENVFDSARIPLLLASGDDLPDCFFRFFESSDEMIKYGDNEGLLRPLNDLITEEVTPHLAKIFAEDRPEVWNFPWSTPKGNLYYFPAIQNNTENNTTMTNASLWYNKEWFAAVGYETSPTTLDEFLDCMRKIKEQDPGNVGEGLVPIACNNAGDDRHPDQIFMNALGMYITNAWMLDGYKKNADGSFSYICAPATDTMYEYLKFMRTLYEEELIDTTMFNNERNDYNAMVSEGRCACFCENEAYLLRVNDSSNWDLLEPLSSDFNSERFIMGGFGGLGTAPSLRRSAFCIISKDCPDLQAEAVCRFVDFAYGYEGPDNEKRYIYWYGPQAGVDDTYGITEGWYFDENNDRIVPEVVNGKYASDEAYRFSVTTNQNNEYMDRRTDGSEFEEGQMYDINTVQGYSQWQKRLHFDPYLNSSIITLAYADNDTTVEQAALTTALQSYIKTETAKFITGERELNDEEWAAYVAELVAYGIDTYAANAEEAFNTLYNNGIVK